MKVFARLADESWENVRDDFMGGECDWHDLRDYSFEVDLTLSSGETKITLIAVPLFKTIDDILDGLLYSLVTGEEVAIENIDFEPLIDLSVRDGSVEISSAEGCVQDSYSNCVRALGQSVVSIVGSASKEVPGFEFSKLVPLMGSSSMILVTRKYLRNRESEG